jgi:energy-coupling factor transport system permease protein
MRPFHPAAWLVWTASAVLVTQSVSHPLLLVVAIAAIAFVSATQATDGGPYALMLRIGLIALAVRVVLFGLTGHPGGTTLATLPVLRLPRALGGFTLGGDVTAEVLVASGLEGLRLAAVLLCFGTFLSVVEVARAIRLVPRFLFEAGLVVAIGVSFVPGLVRTARDVREAQRVRGHRARGLRAVAPVAMPILATTLERAVTVAESMDARGFGRVRGDARAGEARARAAALAATMTLMLGVVATMLRWGPPAAGWAALGAGAAGLAGALVSLSRTAERTAYHRERFTGWDAAVAAGSLTVAAAVLAVHRLEPGSLSYTPYPTLAAPSVSAWTVAMVAALCWPCAVAAARRMRARAMEAAA